jgi:hypothetical protein
MKYRKRALRGLVWVPWEGSGEFHRGFTAV